MSTLTRIITISISIILTCIILYFTIIGCIILAEKKNGDNYQCQYIYDEKKINNNDCWGVKAKSNLVDGTNVSLVYPPFNFNGLAFTIVCMNEKKIDDWISIYQNMMKYDCYFENINDSGITDDYSSAFWIVIIVLGIVNIPCDIIAIIILLIMIRAKNENNNIKELQLLKNEI